eukprot:1158208-Pelagomonas_calceolata.AAC.26
MHTLLSASMRDVEEAEAFSSPCCWLGNRSWMSARKSGTSSATNFDMFMSRSVRIIKNICARGGAGVQELWMRSASYRAALKCLTVYRIAAAKAQDLKNDGPLAHVHLSLKGAIMVTDIRSPRVQAQRVQTCNTHLHNNLAVGHHHGDASEKGLQVFRQLLAARITRVHRDEEAHARVHGHLRPKQESRVTFGHAHWYMFRRTMHTIRARLQPKHTFHAGVLEIEGMQSWMREKGKGDSGAKGRGSKIGTPKQRVFLLWTRGNSNRVH